MCKHLHFSIKVVVCTIVSVVEEVDFESVNDTRSIWLAITVFMVLESGYLPIFPGASTLLKCAAKLDKKLAFSTANAIKMPTRTRC